MKWLIAIPVAIATFIIGVNFYLQPNDFIGCSDRPLEGSGQCEPVDGIVVVSGGDTRARTAEGIKLFNNGWADKLILSGAAQDTTSISNAAAMKIQAIHAGVPESSIYVEEFSQNTQQNAANSQSIFEEQALEKVILVTSGYHQRRANLEFKKSAESTQILNHPLLFDKDWSVWWWLTPRGWWLAGGELVKVMAFYIQGVAE